MNNWKSRLKEQEWKTGLKHPYHRAVKLLRMLGRQLLPALSLLRPS